MKKEILKCNGVRQAISVAQEKTDLDSSRKIKFTKLVPSISFYENALSHDYPHFMAEIKNFSEPDIFSPSVTLKKENRLVSNTLYYQLSCLFACLTYTFI